MRRLAGTTPDSARMAETSRRRIWIGVAEVRHESRPLRKAVLARVDEPRIGDAEQRRANCVVVSIGVVGVPLAHLSHDRRRTIRHHRQQALSALFVVRHVADEEPGTPRCRDGVDVRLKSRPGGEAVLARDDEVRCVQRKRRLLTRAV